jgi:hypothetical protein
VHDGDRCDGLGVPQGREPNPDGRATPDELDRRIDLGDIGGERIVWARNDGCLLYNLTLPTKRIV